MKWLYRHLHKKEKGFTLVELMVVIIILAVLTGIAIPSYLALRNRARTQATRSEMQNIGTAIAIYEADIGLPATGLVALTAALETVPVAGEGAYMSPVPQADAWNIPYVYVLVDATHYTLTSTGGAADIVLTDGQLN